MSDEVADEEREPEAALDDVEPEALERHAAVQAPGTERGKHDEQPREQRERDADRARHRALREALLLGHLPVGRPRQRLEPERQRLGRAS